MKTIQTSLMPDVVSERDGLEVIEKKARKTAMQNSKLFFSLLNQMEENLVKEMDRLTVNSFLWRLFSKIGLIPKRRGRNYGSFIKPFVAFKMNSSWVKNKNNITVEYLVMLEKWARENSMFWKPKPLHFNFKEETQCPGVH